MADIQTFKNMQDKVLSWLDEAGDTSTTLTLVKYALQEANRKRATEEPWPFMLWDQPETLTVSANQLYYALHPEFFRPHYFWNQTVIDAVSVYNDGNFRDSGTDPNTDSGDALHLVLQGRTEVANQPTAASVIAVSSSNVTDNGSATVTLRGVTTDGVVSETVTCGSSTTNSFTKILKVTKNGTWLGTMTLTSNAAAVTNLKLFAGEYGRTYQQFKLLQIPTAAQVLEYGFYRQPQPMTADNDRPEVPSPFEDLLVYDALLSFAAYNQYDAGVVNLWKTKQQEMLFALQKSYADAAPIDGMASYTTYIPR